MLWLFWVFGYLLGGLVALYLVAILVVLLDVYIRSFWETHGPAPLALRQPLAAGDVAALVAAATSGENPELRESAKALIRDRLAKPGLLPEFERLFAMSRRKGEYESVEILREPLLRLRSKTIVPHLLDIIYANVVRLDWGIRSVHDAAYAARDLARVGYGGAPALLRWIAAVYSADSLPALAKRLKEDALNAKQRSLVCAVCSRDIEVVSARAVRLELAASSPDHFVLGPTEPTQICFGCGAFFCNECLSSAFKKAVVTEQETCPYCGGPCTFV